MIKKHRLSIMIGFMSFFFLCAFPVNTKGMEESAVWDITVKGQGAEPYFQSSVEMEIDLKGNNTKDDVSIFINRQKWEGDWDYEKSAKIILREEGNYTIHFVHKNGYEETKKIIVELSNPQRAKIDTRSYEAGTWTNHDILLKAYGSKAVSDISHYEYKLRDSEWKIMRDRQIEIKDNFDEEIMIRAVSKAGRQGDITKIWCRLWKDDPEIPRILCDQKSQNGWYRVIPNFFCEIKETKGAPVHIYARLVNVETKQAQTGVDSIPQIKEDGKYHLIVWAEDEAGNRSKANQMLYFVDTIKPQIFVKYKKSKNIHGVLKYQSAEIKIRDKNLQIMSMKIKTSGRQIRAWKKTGEYYQTEIIFHKEGVQNLWIKAEDMAGNSALKQEKSFKIDTTKPDIVIQGISDGKSYKKPVILDVKVKDENLDTKKTKIMLNGRRWSGGKIQKDGYYTIKVETQDFAENKNMLKKTFTINQKGINIHFLRKNLKGKYISDRNVKPGFQIVSLEPVEVKNFLVNREKAAYEWKKDKVYLKDPITQNGKYTISLSVKDANGYEKSSEEISFYYDTQKPVIKMKGVDKNRECTYGEKIVVSLENQKDYWKKIQIDGKNINSQKSKIYLNKLEPGVHILNLEAEDLALNKTKQTIKFTVTKVLPNPIKKIAKTNNKVKERSKINSKKTERNILIIPSMILMAAVVVFIYKKRSKL